MSASSERARKPDPELQRAARGAISSIRARRAESGPEVEIAAGGAEAKFMLVRSLEVVGPNLPVCQGAKCARPLGVGERMMLVVKIRAWLNAPGGPGTQAWLCVHCTTALGSTIRRAQIPERVAVPHVPEGVEPF